MNKNWILYLIRQAIDCEWNFDSKKSRLTDEDCHMLVSVSRRRKTPDLRAAWRIGFFCTMGVVERL